MLESETVTPETAVEAKELKELIARLANPNHGAPQGLVQVKDIAETLDVDERVVMQQLVALRESKKVHPVPVEVEKLAAVLDTLKTSDFQPLSNKPLKRVSVASVLLVLAVFVGMFLIAFSLSQSQPITPPQPVHAEITKSVPPIRGDLVAPKPP